jgi:hypothetical protein
MASIASHERVTSSHAINLIALAPTQRDIKLKDEPAAESRSKSCGKSF